MSMQQAVAIPNTVPAPIPTRRRLPPVRDRIAAGLRSERVEGKLKGLPGWKQVTNGPALDRVRAFSSPEVAEIFYMYVAKLVQVLRKPATVQLMDKQVIVRLHADVRRGRCLDFTDGVFDLAAEIG